MTDHHFLCLTNDDLGLESPTIRGIVYCPGLVCTHCQMPVTYGVILDQFGYLEMLGRHCATEHKPTRWIDHIKRLCEFQSLSELTVFKQCSSYKQKNYFRILTIYKQIFPENAMGRLLYSEIMENGSLKAHQIQYLQALLQDCASLEALTAHRDVLCRLNVLASLGNQLEDQLPKILGLLEFIKTRGLSKRQVGMVIAIQQEYGGCIVPLTEKLLGNWPPRNGRLSLSL